jgi:hypothetical protein
VCYEGHALEKKQTGTLLRRYRDVSETHFRAQSLRQKSCPKHSGNVFGTSGEHGNVSPKTPRKRFGNMLVCSAFWSISKHAPCNPQPPKDSADLCGDRTHIRSIKIVAATAKAIARGRSDPPSRREDKGVAASLHAKATQKAVITLNPAGGASSKAAPGCGTAARLYATGLHREVAATRRLGGAASRRSQVPQHRDVIT